MPPRSSKDKLIEDDEILQAVIIADSFNDRFKPLTILKPRVSKCLIPLCNVPLLDWTFESLAIAGVQKVYVMSRAHTQQIHEAIRISKWSHPRSGLQIVPLPLSTSVHSFGDAMRQLDGQQIITSDFILVNGDLVSNVRIDEVVKEHKERRKSSKEVIMTMVVKEAGPGHRTRPAGDTSLFVLDSDTSECLHYEPVLGIPAKKNANIPREIFKLHREVQIRNDFIDCGIDVCSVDVPLLFTENFDYEDLRRDFVHGVLTSDLLDKTMFCHIAKKGYAARVKDTKTYAAVSKDILSRWTFPLVPDDNYPGDYSYEHARGNRYIAKSGVALSRTCKIDHNTLIASGVKIQDNVTVSSSVIGSSTRIGVGTVIQDSYIWDGVEIGPRCVIEESIIASNVRILEGSVIRKGCLIGEGVTIGPRASLDSMLRLAKYVPREDDKNESEDEGANEEDKRRLGLGENFDGYVYIDDGASEDGNDSDDSDGMANIELPPNINLLRLGDETYLSDPPTSSSSEFDSEAEEDDDGLSSVPPMTPTMPSSARSTEFEFEAIATLERCVDEGISIDDTALELKTLRMSSNADQERVKEIVLDFIVRQIEGQEAVSRARIDYVLNKWGRLIEKVGGNGVGVLVQLQSVCAKPESRHKLFEPLIFWMYQEDIAEEEDIHEWHNMATSRGGNAGYPELWEIGQKVIDRLEEASEEEDDDDDDDGDE